VTGGEIGRLLVERRPGAVLATITGEIDLSNAGQLEDAFASAVGDATAVVLDLSGLEYIDSAGLAVLSRLSRRMTDRGGALRLVVPDTATVRRTLTIAGVDAVLPVDPTAEEALAAVTEPPPPSQAEQVDRA